jgi:hypothetical protein
LAGNVARSKLLKNAKKNAKKLRLFKTQTGGQTDNIKMKLNTLQGNGMDSSDQNEGQWRVLSIINRLMNFRDPLKAVNL